MAPDIFKDVYVNLSAASVLTWKMQPFEKTNIQYIHITITRFHFHCKDLTKLCVTNCEGNAMHRCSLIVSIFTTQSKQNLM